VTGELEVSNLSDIIPDACCVTTAYGTAAPTAPGANAGDTYYVTPLGTAADAANATAQYRWDGTQWVLTPGAGGATTACVYRMETETFTATDGQTSFTLAHTPSDDVTGSRDGIILADGAFTVSGTTVTYVPAANNGSALCAGQPITISYTWQDCSESSGAGGTTEVADGVTILGAGTPADPFRVAKVCEVAVKVVTADYTLTADDNGDLIYVDSATPVTITAPAGLPAGFISQIYQKGAGQVTVVGGAGNTLRSANGFKTRVQHSAIGVSYETGALSNITGDSAV
jgi:hypothetical protein